MFNSKQNEVLTMKNQANYYRAGSGNEIMNKSLEETRNIKATVKKIKKIVESGSFSLSYKKRGTQPQRQENRNKNTLTKKKWWSLRFPCIKTSVEKEDAFEWAGGDFETSFNQENREPLEERFKRLSDDPREDEIEENLRSVRKDLKDMYDLMLNDILFQCKFDLVDL